MFFVDVYLNTQEEPIVYEFENKNDAIRRFNDAAKYIEKPISCFESVVIRHDDFILYEV